MERSSHTTGAKYTIKFPILLLLVPKARKVHLQEFQNSTWTHPILLVQTKHRGVPCHFQRKLAIGRIGYREREARHTWKDFSREHSRIITFPYRRIFIAKQTNWIQDTKHRGKLLTLPVMGFLKWRSQESPEFMKAIDKTTQTKCKWVPLTRSLSLQYGLGMSCTDNLSSRR